MAQIRIDSTKLWIATLTAVLLCKSSKGSTGSLANLNSTNKNTKNNPPLAPNNPTISGSDHPISSSPTEEVLMETASNKAPTNPARRKQPRKSILASFCRGLSFVGVAEPVFRAISQSTLRQIRTPEIANRGIWVLVLLLGILRRTDLEVESPSPAEGIVNQTTHWSTQSAHQLSIQSFGQLHTRHQHQTRYSHIPGKLLFVICLSAHAFSWIQLAYIGTKSDPIVLPTTHQ